MLERFVRGIIEKEGKKSVVDLPVDEISVNPYQPRRTFDPDKLDELAKSIREQGVLQPVIARKFGGGYELVAGERRLRACKLIGLKTIPAIVRQLDDQDMIEIAFIENLQREQLDDVETAEAVGKMAASGGDIKAVAERIGRDVDSVKAKLWMLKLPQVVKKAVVSKLITVEHARVLSEIVGEKKQMESLEKIYREKLTVEQTRELVGSLPEYMKAKRGVEQPLSAKTYRYSKESLGRAAACVDMIRQLVGEFRAAGVRVEVSELVTGKSVNVRLSFPLEREEAAAQRRTEASGE